MTTEQTAALVAFLRNEQPVSMLHLWGRLCIARKWNQWEELPATLDALETAIGYLEARGYVLAQGDDWVMRYPQPRERVVGQLELFA